MGASNFLVYYGLRWDVLDSELDALQRRTDPRQIAAREHGLDCWFGVTNEESHFVLLGRAIGNYGWEYLANSQIDDEQLAALMADTKAKLVAAGYADVPALHCQFEPDF